MICLLCADASEVYANTDVSPNYETAVAGLVHGLSGGVVTTTSTSKASSTTTIKTSTTNTKASTTSTKSGTTTTVTKTSSTSTSAIASPTSTPGGTCPVNNGQCSANGAYACAGSQFGICNNNAWVLQSCPSGTTCFSTTDGTSIYCGQGTGGSCSSSSAAVIAAQAFSNPAAPVKPVAGPTAKPFTSSHVTAQISVSKANMSNFAAVINARRLDTTTFGKTVMVQFKVATNIKVTQVENGTVVQKGSNVKITVNNDDTEIKAIIIGFSGDVKSGVFVTPDIATITIN